MSNKSKRKNESYKGLLPYSCTVGVPCTSTVCIRRPFFASGKYPNQALRIIKHFIQAEQSSTMLCYIVVNSGGVKSTKVFLYD
jgi:hypothetical protein